MMCKPKFYPEISCVDPMNFCSFTIALNDEAQRADLELIEGHWMREFQDYFCTACIYNSRMLSKNHTLCNL